MEKGVGKQSRYDLGVLLVHGIGQQVQGDTLVRFGEPVQRWLQRWISQNSALGDIDRSPVAEARFTPRTDDIEAPARAELHIKTNVSDLGEQARWLLAESWWANTFLTPSFGELATWGLQILPWSLSTHFATRTRRVLQNFKAAQGLIRRSIVAGQLALEVFGFLLAVLLFPVLATLMMLVLVVGVLPIPRVRAFAARLQRILSGTLGDSFVLIASPIQEAVIVGKVERDLRWLLKADCRHIAVVAHSQGAAVAHAALKKIRSAERAVATEISVNPVREILFVTVGSGLNKLAGIRRVTKSNPSTVWIAPAGLLMLALSLPEVYRSFRVDEGNFFALYAAISGLMLFLIGIIAVWKENLPRPDELKFDSKIKWLDYYASADPVPNGPMFDKAIDTEKVMDTHKVHNLASPFFDHVTYWRNEDGFLSQLVCALGEHGDVPLFRDNSLDRSHVMVAMDRRQWRVQWLVSVRLLITALTASIAFRYWDQLPSMTEGPLNTLASMVKWVPLVGDFLVPVSKFSVVSQLAGVAALIIFGLTAYYTLYGAWVIWNKADIAAFFERKSFETLSGSFMGFLLLFLGVVEAFGLSFAGYSAGLLPGLVAAGMTWLAILISGVVIVVFTKGVLHNILKMARDIWRIVFDFIRNISEKKPEQESSPETPKSEVATTRRLIDWREDRYSPLRLVLSFFVLILLSFPYQTFIAAPMGSDQLWVERWHWGFGLVSAIEHQSENLKVSQWEWLLGTLVIVLSVNAVGLLGGFKRPYRWFVRAAHAGPIALAHARQLPRKKASKVLKQAASLLMKDYEAWESIFEELRAEELRAENGKAEVRIGDETNGVVIRSGSDTEKSSAKLLRVTARQVCAIVERLDKDDPDAQDLLKRLVRTSPEAALMLAERIGRIDPETATWHLSLHVDQPNRFLRNRIRRELEKYRHPR